MKSMCHEPRRSSPSVAACSPIASCMRTAVAHGVVLDRAQLVGLEAPVGVVGARLQERGRAQQAADVIGAERRLGTPGHRDAVLDSRVRFAREPRWVPRCDAYCHMPRRSPSTSRITSPARPPG